MSWAANFEDFQRCPSMSSSSVAGRGRSRGPLGRGLRAPPGGGRAQSSGAPVAGHSGGPSVGGIGAFGAQFQLKNDGSDVQMIGELSPLMSVAKIVGVIIAKGPPRHFANKKDANSERYVFTFTLRDSPTDFINVTCWGSEQYIKQLVSQYHIGQVVQLENVDIQTKANDGSDDKFKPWTPSPYQLSLNDARGNLMPFTDWNVSDYLRLLQIPVRSSNDFYTISDIITNGPALVGEVINIMGVVRQVGQVKQMNSKNGSQLQKCDVTLFDATSPAFMLALWDEELINLAQTWIPKEHIIFAADVRVTYDDWKKKMVSTAIAKTILTVNPDTAEAHSLFLYSRSLDLNSEDFDMSADEKDQTVSLAEITTVYKIEQLKDPCLKQKSQNNIIYGIVYGFVSAFNIDDSISSVISTRCSRCHYRIAKNAPGCSNQNCPPSLSLGSVQPQDITNVYDVRISLTDETGTLSGCFLAGDAAEKMIGCPVEEFVNLNDAKRSELKWNFLLERCKVYLKVSHLQNPERKQPSIRILGCEMANIKEAVSSLVH